MGALVHGENLWNLRYFEPTVKESQVLYSYTEAGILRTPRLSEDSSRKIFSEIARVHSRDLKQFLFWSLGSGVQNPLELCPSGRSGTLSPRSLIRYNHRCPLVVIWCNCWKITIGILHRNTWQDNFFWQNGWSRTQTRLMSTFSQNGFYPRGRCCFYLIPLVGALEFPIWWD